MLQKLSTDVAQLLSASGSESASAAQKRAEAVRKRAHLAAEMQKLEDELSTLPPVAPSANLAKAPEGMMSEHYWTHDKIKLLREDLARIPQVNVGTGRVTGDALALSSLYLNKVEVVCMWDLGCTPPALVESSKLQQWNEARVSAAHCGFGSTDYNLLRHTSEDLWNWKRCDNHHWLCHASSHVSESTSDGSGHRHDKWQYGCQ